MRRQTVVRLRSTRSLTLGHARRRDTARTDGGCGDSPEPAAKEVVLADLAIDFPFSSRRLHAVAFDGMELHASAGSDKGDMGSPKPPIISCSFSCARRGPFSPSSAANDNKLRPGISASENQTLLQSTALGALTRHPGRCPYRTDL